jgi:tetratricopeptide (TPR) repeat protein
VSDQNSEYSPALRQAIDLLRGGQGAEAEAVMRRAADEAVAQAGADSHAAAVAHNELGMILLNVGQVPQAVAAFRTACAGPPPDEAARRDRLTFLTNLGMAHEYANQLPEAEEAYRQTLAGRLLLYGKDHAGYGFGLEPLAANLLRQGKAAEARDLIEETVENFWKNRHARIATALALRAEIYKAAGVDKHPFEELDDLPNELVRDLAEAVIDRMRRTDLNLSRRVLADLLPFVRHRLGEAHQSTLNVLASIANLERHLGGHQTRQQAIREAIAIYDRSQRSADALNATLGLALALGEAGSRDEALAAYRNALVRAHALNDAAWKSQVLRNYGLYLVDLERREEAEKQLRRAVLEGEQCNNLEMLGRSQVALGIFLQHGGQLKEAAPLLDQGLHNLDPANPDAVTGRNHLNAILAGGSCNCGDMGKALADAFREFVLARLPAGMISQLDVKPRPDGNFDIGVQLDRELNQDEMEQINHVLNHALAEFKDRMAQPH